MALQTFDPSATPAEVAAATLKDGAAVVSGLVSVDLAETVAGELRENLDKDDYSQHYRTDPPALKGEE